jgi:hypothetical protein
MIVCSSHFMRLTVSSDTFERVSRDLLIIIALAIAGWKLTYGLAGVLDIGLNDESFHLFFGTHLLKHGFLGATKGPLYPAWYFLLSKLQPDRIALYYLNYSLLTILFPIAVYIVLRCYGVSLQWSIAIAFFSLISYANVSVWPKICHFALIINLVALSLATLPKSLQMRLNIVSGGVLLSSFVRPELFIAFILLIVLYLGQFLVNRSQVTAKDTLLLIILVVLTVILITQLGLPIGSHRRNMLAFSQHFSINWVQWTHSNLSPWLDWESIIRRNFGDVKSVLAAALNNPIVFLRHIANNVIHITKPFLTLYFLHAVLLLPSRYRRVEAFVLMATLGFTSVWWRRELISGLRARIPQQHFLLFVAGCLLVPSFLAVILIYPREHYLLPICVLAIIVASVLLSDRESITSLSFKYMLALATLIVMLTPALPPMLATPEGQPNVRTINALESLRIKQTVNILEAEGGFSYYLLDNFHYVQAWEKTANEDFNTFRVRRNINMVILTDKLKAYSGLRKDQNWLGFIDNPESFGFTVLPLAGTNRVILVERQLLSNPKLSVIY